MFRLIVIALLLTPVLPAADHVPVVIELFTSEGCSSCPPADELLAQLENKQPVPNVDVIVLSEHVDYWNRLGWTDPFSSSLFSQRQQSYATLLRSNDVYTPQAIIDGHYATVGSNRPNVLKAITASGQTAKPDLQLTVTRSGNLLMVDVPQATTGEVWVALTEAKRVSRVANGENGGRTLQHVGVVRSLTKLSSNHTQIAVDKNWTAGLRIVAFVQDGPSGRILQAVQKNVE